MNSGQMFGNFRFKMAIPGAILTNLRTSGVLMEVEIEMGMGVGCIMDAAIKAGDGQQRSHQSHVNDT